MAAVLVAVLVITLTPGAASGPAPCPPWQFRCGELDSVDSALNLGLFLPLGVALGLWRPRSGTTYLLPVLLSLAIELVQLIPSLHRTASLRDLLANGLGGGAGVWLGGCLPALRRPTADLARRALLAGSLTLTGLLSLGGALLQPSHPATVWYGQWAPTLGQFDRFGGTVDEATLNGWPMPAGRIAASAEFRTRARATGYDLAARVHPGSAPPDRIAPIASVFDQDEHQIALLGRRRNELVFSSRIVAQDLRFQALTGAMSGAFRQGAGGALRIEGRRLPDQLVLSWATDAGRATYTQRLSPIDAWRVLLPVQVALGPAAAWIGATLLALLFAPLGFWGRRSGSAPLLVAALTLAPALVALVAPGFGFGPAPAGAWIGVVGGWLTGWRAGRAG